MNFYLHSATLYFYCVCISCFGALFKFFVNNFLYYFAHVLVLFFYCFAKLFVAISKFVNHPYREKNFAWILFTVNKSCSALQFLWKWPPFPQVKHLGWLFVRFLACLLHHLLNFSFLTFSFSTTSIVRTLLIGGLEIVRAVSYASAKATVSVKVVFCEEHTANLMSGSRMPLTNVSVLKLASKEWFSPGYVSCTNLSTSLAFSARHLNSMRYNSRLYSSLNLRFKSLQLFLRLAGIASSISVGTPLNAGISSNALSTSSHPFLMATVSNWNLNTDRGKLPSMQGGFTSYLLILLALDRVVGSGGCWCFPPS